MLLSGFFGRERVPEAMIGTRAHRQFGSNADSIRQLEMLLSQNSISYRFRTVAGALILNH
jgi:hypothetical protein